MSDERNSGGSVNNEFCMRLRILLDGKFVDNPVPVVLLSMIMAILVHSTFSALHFVLSFFLGE